MLQSRVASTFEFPNFSRAHPISSQFDSRLKMTRRTFDPSLFSTSNLCCNMTISRSPCSYCILASSVAHSVSNKFPRGLTVSCEKIPIHRNPEMIRSSSAGDEKLASFATAARRVLWILTRARQFTLEYNWSDNHPTLQSCQQFQEPWQ